MPPQAQHVLATSHECLLTDDTSAEREAIHHQGFADDLTAANKDGKAPIPDVAMLLKTKLLSPCALMSGVDDRQLARSKRSVRNWERIAAYNRQSADLVSSGWHCSALHGPAVRGTAMRLCHLCGDASHESRPKSRMTH